MFIAFFTLLRQRGIQVTLSEWLTLLEALSKGLHHSSLTDFYYMARAILVHDESDYDRFDGAFLTFFRDVPWEDPIPDEILQWLDRPMEQLAQLQAELLQSGMPQEELQELLQRLEERLREQKEEHNGGNYWVGTQGRSPFGNSGWHPGGIRIGGEGRHRTAVTVAGERHFQDFRKDQIMDTRQFQMAFRTLRQLSHQVNAQEEEFDVDGTVRATCDNGGVLTIRTKHPRRNAIKLLILMDAGGSMAYYSRLCNTLFQAAEKSRHFKELHIYFFHNCPYDFFYEEPTLVVSSLVAADWITQNYSSDYRLLIVGDGAMHYNELFGHAYHWATRSYSVNSGIGSYTKLRDHFSHAVWLNPEGIPTSRNFWTETQFYLMDLFPMFPLSTEGLEMAMRRLMQK